MGISPGGRKHPGREHRTEKSVLLDMSGDYHQFAAAHSGVEASQLDRALLSDLEAPAGDRGLPGAQRRCVLRPPGLTPDGPSESEAVTSGKDLL
jgi:hypothetical protein